MKKAKKIELKLGAGEKMEITVKLFEKRFLKCCLLQRGGNGEMNGLKIIVAKM